MSSQYDWDEVEKEERAVLSGSKKGLNEGVRRRWSWATLLLLLLGLILLLVGLSMIASSSRYQGQTQGRILNVVCPQQGTAGSANNNTAAASGPCKLTIEYYASGKPYVQDVYSKVSNPNVPYYVQFKKGDYVVVYYDTSNPGNTVYITAPPKPWVGSPCYLDFCF